MDIEARARRIAFGADDTVGNVLDRVRTNEEQWEARLADANREWNAAVRDQRTAERERDAALAKLKYVEQALRSNEDALIEQRDVQRAARLTAEREAFQLRSLLRRCEPCIPDGSELAKDVRRGLSGTTEAGK